MCCKRRLSASEEYKSERSQESFLSPSTDTRPRDRLPTFLRNSQHSYSSIFPSSREILPDRTVGGDGGGCDRVHAEAPSLQQQLHLEMCGRSAFRSCPLLPAFRGPPELGEPVHESLGLE